MCVVYTITHDTTSNRCCSLYIYGSCVFGCRYLRASFFVFGYLVLWCSSVFLYVLYTDMSVACMYIYIHTYIHTCIYTYIHTYICYNMTLRFIHSYISCEHTLRRFIMCDGTHTHTHTHTHRERERERERGRNTHTHSHTHRHKNKPQHTHTPLY